MVENEFKSTYECLACGTIIKSNSDKAIIKCSCGSKKINKIAGAFKNEDELDFFEIQRYILQQIITRQEDDASESLVEYIMAGNHIYTTRDDAKSEIWMYDDGIYKPNGESFIKEVVRKVLVKSYTPQRANKVIAKIQADTMIDPNEFFDTKYLDEICVANGILNLKTREITEFTPDKIFFNKLTTEYNPDAKCENIDKFFREILKDKEDTKVLYELTGFCLHKDYFIEKAFMFLGNGRNGKGKTLSLLKNFLGAENTCSVRLTQMEDNSSALCELHNSLVNLAGDLSNTSLKDTGLFKELTGRDSVQVKRKYLRDLMFTNYAKMVFACNDLPRVYDLSEGFWSRWVLLEFPYKFLPQHEISERSEEEQKICRVQDPDLLDKLTTSEELSGLLNAALDGLDRIKNNKDFSYSKGTADIKNFWMRKSDSFTAFCLDIINEDAEGYITKKELRQTFVKYCKLHGIKNSSDKNIKIVLENMFGVIESRKGSSYENQESVWEGIKFKENYNSKDSDTIPTTLGNGNYSTLEKPIPTLTIEDNKDKSANKFLDSIGAKPFSDEEIKKAGYTKEEYEELIKEPKKE